MKIHDAFPQGSPEWFAVRAGKATASEFSAILAKGEGKMRAKALRRIVAECLTGKPAGDSYSNGHMERGQQQEPLAGMAYEIATGNILRKVGFIEHDRLRAGCSPDALLVDQRGGAEIKCVIPTVQLETIQRGGYPPEHRPQIQGSLWITEYDFWDFVSYSPDFPQRHLQLYKFRIQRDEACIALIEKEVRALLLEADAICERLLRMDMPLEEQLRASLKPEAVAA